MADAQVGNVVGVAQPGNLGKQVEISADGVNTVTVNVDGLFNLDPGARIDIINKTTGAVLASNRIMTNITSAGVVTYDGADVAAVPGTHVIVPTGGTILTGAQNSYVNLNGGSATGVGYSEGAIDSITEMRTRLNQFSGTTFTTERLNSMTYNDLVFACRSISGAI